MIKLVRTFSSIMCGLTWIMLDKEASDIDNFYILLTMKIIKGMGVGQIRCIKSYDAETKICKIQHAQGI